MLETEYVTNQEALKPKDEDDENDERTIFLGFVVCLRI